MSPSPREQCRLPTRMPLHSSLALRSLEKWRPRLRPHTTSPSTRIPSPCHASELTSLHSSSNAALPGCARRGPRCDPSGRLALAGALLAYGVPGALIVTGLKIVS